MILITHRKHLLGLSLLLLASLFTPKSALSQQTLGCYNVDKTEFLGKRQPGAPGPPDYKANVTTKEGCRTFCSSLARKYAGWTPNVSQCHCGNVLNIKNSGPCRPPGGPAKVGIKCTDVPPDPKEGVCRGGSLTIVDLLGVPPVTRPTNRPPNKPTLNPNDWLFSNPSAVDLAWRDNGDPDGDALTFGVYVMQYDPAIRQWVPARGFRDQNGQLRAIWLTGTTIYSFSRQAGYQPGATYYWAVIACEVGRTADQPCTPSEWSSFRK